MSHPAELDDWARRLIGTLGLEGAEVDVNAVLDLARDAAHGVARPAAPLTAYLVGIAVGRGMPLSDATAAAVALIPDDA